MLGLFLVVMAALPLGAQTAISADGVVESTSGGFKFPDGTVQTTAAAPGTAPVEDTGQTKCWNALGNPIRCSGTGQDGALQRGVDWPTPRFTDNGNGTVTDNLTGLIWLEDANCASFFAPIDFEDALAAANGLSQGFCGLNDGSVAGEWRLPNIKELLSLVDYGESGPALPLGHPFTSVQLAFYWSSSSYADAPHSPANAWTVLIYNGEDDIILKTNSLWVWPVRGGGSAQVEDTGQQACYDPTGATGDTIPCAMTGQDGELQRGVDWPAPRFTDNGDGTVTDNLTGLIWLQLVNCLGGRTWTDALSDANGLMTGQCNLTDGSVPTEWRLPNVKELSSLLDYGQVTPALPLGHPFPSVQSSNTYWSSSSYVFNPEIAWAVNLWLGGDVLYDKSTNLYNVWPVRGGQ